MKYLPTYQQFITESKSNISIKKHLNRRGDFDGLIVNYNDEDYHLQYSADELGEDPYGIIMPGDDTVSFINRDKAAKKIWSKIKPSVKLFLSTNESKEESFEDKIKGDGYYKGISTSTARKKAAQMKKQANMPDDDPDAYQPLPGDTKGKKLLKKSKHTKTYDELYGDERNESVLEKAEGDRSPIDNKAIEAGIKKKSEETGVPVPFLRIVMRRGMAAWKSGHRPGAGQEQWGYARLNSFLTKAPGTWGRPIDDPKKGGPKGSYGADADVAQEVIKGGYDKNLKKA